mmetsp:Transcript_82971/g.268845  ORF Transcript_82971/g.268845 Transcript_82971/m.268845 type:complete len:276 (-) Transcript_82971:78-905(-)|eukprot:CAMPEP_0203859908 /NCGR_PEP_ID=MMETSP0359-20131031/12122_1 /ASSEMBLY_ACC=CAM_ASM_000338 /TAXON_ID=268821 /ORGANISM="Scrippsiella Hangoei, Strain SHTV-5" /LENGTH=275 /DNA_ID=CAMNT_0050776901 /DNA_START=54 /DNA_END=881 /DNA_ORIENTATION=-
MAEAAPQTAADGQPPAEGAASTVRRRRGPQEVQEVVDELAQETKRTSLLQAVETQLKGQPHVSRILVGFGVVDDRKVHDQITQEFTVWRKKLEETDDLTGFLVFANLSAVHFLEGPTELLFAALEKLQSLAVEVEKPQPGEAARPALIGPVRILHFTEMHGVRASTSWCTHTHTGKKGQEVQIEENNSAELMFKVYQKMLLLCAKVKDNDPSGVPAAYKKAADGLPTVDEIAVLLGKVAAEFFFSYDEFEKVFVAPFNLVLHSELLWPMAPALSY